MGYGVVVVVVLVVPLVVAGVALAPPIPIARSARRKTDGRAVFVTVTVPSLFWIACTLPLDATADVVVPFATVTLPFFALLPTVPDVAPLRP